MYCAFFSNLCQGLCFQHFCSRHLGATPQQNPGNLDHDSHWSRLSFNMYIFLTLEFNLLEKISELL